MLPTVKPRELFIYGWLLPADLCDTTVKEANIKRFGMYIRAFIPANIQKKMLKWKIFVGQLIGSLFLKSIDT